MSFRSSLNPLRLALLAGAIGLGLTATAAKAQDGAYRDVVYGADGTERVIVRPSYDDLRRYPDGTVTLSREVSFADLDLSTRAGARELRSRVRDTAREVCAELRDRTDSATDLNRMDMGRCEHDAYRDAMDQAHDAIADARESGYSQSAYRGDDDDDGD
ncbi:MAG: UrcA family protein [Rhizomicrobium sp.]